MNSLEHILDISSAIERQKRGSVLNSILDTIFPKANKKPQEDSKSNNKINEEIKINLFEKPKSTILEENDKKYNFLDSFIEYLSNLKGNLYDYYSKAKDTLKKTLYRVGYTDKLLKEIEDWGVIYFRTVFQNLKRITPLGQIHRYMQHLWICQTKNIK